MGFNSGFKGLKKEKKEYGRNERRNLSFLHEI
jgi:hypothetical protein